MFDPLSSTTPHHALDGLIIDYARPRVARHRLIFVLELTRTNFRSELR